MKTFKQFLEAENKDFSSEGAKDTDEIVALIRKHCTEAVQSWEDSNGDRELWRGSKNKRPSGIFRPDTGERKSANSGNYYTMLLDSNPLNKDFPKRSKSFITTTKLRVARAYGKKGTVYAVFPFDGVKVGLVNQSDIWETPVIFGNGKEFAMKTTLQEMNQDFWPEMHQALGFDAGWTPTMEDLLDQYEQKDPALFIQECIDQKILPKDEYSESQAKSLFDSFLDQIPIAYSYKSMGCKLEDAGAFADEDTEVWFSGPCIMVNDSDWIGVSMELGL